MALKRKRKIKTDDLNFKLAQVAVKGVLVTYDAVTDGFVKLDAAIASPSFTPDKVVGMLMFDVVDRDFNALPVNFQKLETGLSGFVRLAKEGEIGTDQLDAGAVFGPGSGVFLGANGTIATATVSPSGERVGTALASVDSDGFVEIYLDID